MGQGSSRQFSGTNMAGAISTVGALSENQSVHGRHLAPACRFTPASSDGSSAASIALAVPYLHWETERNRDAFSHIIGTETARHRMRMRKIAELGKEQRRALRSSLPPPSRPKIPHLAGGGGVRPGPGPDSLLRPLAPTWSNIFNEFCHISPSTELWIRR